MQLKQFIQLEHDVWYIDWKKEAVEIELDAIAFNKKLSDCRAQLKRVKCIAGGKTLRNNFPNNTYDEYVPKKYRKKQYRIYCNIDGQYIIYKSHRFGKTINKKTQNNPYDLVVDKFKERTGLGLEAMYKAFGTVPYEYRDCVPTPLCYHNPLYLSKSSEQLNVIYNVGSIDGCSQYPTALCGLLPDAKESKTVYGTIKPTKDYPFAFYLKSGHVAVYKEFDTHDWENHTWGKIIYRHKTNFIKQDEDTTVLMKASNYNFKPEMEHFFNIKENYPKDSPEREDAKLVMNAFIGNMWMSNPASYNRRKYAHIVAIAQARALQRMLYQLDRIYFMDVIHICVDGIIYAGTQHYGELGVHERKLGNFEQEFTNAEMVMRQYNTYIVKATETGKVLKSKHGSYDTFSDGTLITEDLSDYHDLFNLSRTDNSSDYDKVTAYKKGQI